METYLLVKIIFLMQYNCVNKLRMDTITDLKRRNQNFIGAKNYSTSFGGRQLSLCLYF